MHGHPHRARFIIPAWSETVGALIAEGAVVTARCSSCETEVKADLARIAAEKGELYSLWNRTTPCRTRGCRGSVWFYAVRPGSGVWQTNMRNADEVVVGSIHARWAETQRRRDATVEARPEARAAQEESMTQIADPLAQAERLLADPAAGRAHLDGFHKLFRRYATDPTLSAADQDAAVRMSERLAGRLGRR